MSEKNRRISRLEGTVLLLTALFAAGTLLWFQMTKPAAGLTFVETAAPTERAEIESAPEAPGMLEGERLDLNTAPPADFTRLPGIGEKKAAAIVAYRAENGGFSSVEELLEVDGIGPGILEDLIPYVTVAGEEPGQNSLPAKEDGPEHGGIGD